jgi:hypothetical protein
LLAGCQAIPQAGLLYSQHTVGGLEIAVGDATASTSPAHIKIGYSNDFGTFIPMAVGKNAQITDIYSLLASARIPDSAVDERVKAAVTKAIQDGTLFDVISVYSSFETAFKAQTQSPSAQVDAGNVFATGFAARHLTRAKLAAACVRIQELIDATAAAEADKKKQLETMRKAQCS